MKKNVAINGIFLGNQNSEMAFYSVFDNVVILDTAYDKSGNVICKGELYNYFKSREKDLTTKHGKDYCPKHSRKFANDICDICGYKKLPLAL
jgi:hypothetical protein